MSSMSVARSSARENIAAVVNEAATKSAMRKLFKTLLGSETLGTAVCPKCGETMKVAVPDVKRQIDGLTALLEQAEGRPGLQGSGGVSVVVERPPL